MAPTSEMKYKVLCWATENFPTSPILLKEKLIFFIETDQYGLVTKTFDEVMIFSLFEKEFYHGINI